MENKLGAYLRQQRKKKGLSIRELGKLSGLSYSYIAQLERGTDPRTGKVVIPTIQTLTKLARGLNIPIDVFLINAGYTNQVHFQGLNDKSLQDTFEYELKQYGLDLNQKEKQSLKKFVEYILEVKSNENINDNQNQQIPNEILEFITKKENQNLIKLILSMQNQGYSNEVIMEWLKSLSATLSTIREKYDLGKGEGKVLKITQKSGTYKADENHPLAKKLKNKLNDPNFKPPWEND